MVVIFIGDKKIKAKEDIKKSLMTIIKYITIETEEIFFIFGDEGKFCKICLELVSEMKKDFPMFFRINVRKEYQYITNKYRKKIMQSYDYTCFPTKIRDVGGDTEIKRNEYLIDKADVCIFNYNEKKQDKSSDVTGYAVSYAKRKSKEIFNIF